MISLEGLAEDVRRLAPGAAASRVLMLDSFDQGVLTDSSRRFNAYVAKLRDSTGFPLQVSTMDGVAAGRITRCFIVERTS